MRTFNAASQSRNLLASAVAIINHHAGRPEITPHTTHSPGTEKGLPLSARTSASQNVGFMLHYPMFCNLLPYHVCWWTRLNLMNLPSSIVVGSCSSDRGP